MKNLIGIKFGRLIVINEEQRNKKYIRNFMCKCDCGNIVYVNYSNLTTSHTKSCGCLHKENTSISNRKYEALTYKNKTYQSWCNMINRTTLKGVAKFKKYEEKNIKVCKEWINSYDNFLKDMGERPLNKTLDRIDNDGDYNKSNCRWATIKEQQNNMSSNVVLSLNNESLTIKQWSEKLNIPYDRIRGRIRLKWNVEKILKV